MSIVHWPPAEDRNEPETLIARAFGARPDDLAVDFLAPLDIAISAVLEACLSCGNGDAFSGADVAGWTVAKRRQGLLAVAVITSGPMRNLTTDCGNPDCGERIQLTLDLTAFRQDWRQDRIEVALQDGQHLILRHPTPTDLSRCVRHEADGAAEAELARILLVGKAPDWPGWEDAAEAALSGADRLADLELRATCPDCGAPAAHLLVLESFLMEELAVETVRLMDEIHVLALAYHWSEQKILALPEGRRRHYLGRVREAWAA